MSFQYIASRESASMSKINQGFLYNIPGFNFLLHSQCYNHQHLSLQDCLGLPFLALLIKAMKCKKSNLLRDCILFQCVKSIIKIKNNSFHNKSKFKKLLTRY